MSSLDPVHAFMVEADLFHPAVARVLRIDPAQEGATFALSAFRRLNTDDGHRVAAAWPAPRSLGVTDDGDGIRRVMLWNPKTGETTIYGDAQPQLFGTFPDDKHGLLFGNALLFMQDWARKRAQFWNHYRANRDTMARIHGIDIAEPDLVPGCIAIGDPFRIRWPQRLPETIECIGGDPKRIRAAILKSRNMPDIVASQARAAA